MDFSGAPEECKVAERYWAGVVRELEESLGQVGQWHRWMLKSYWDGTPWEDQWNPIFDARSYTLDRAFRIIQHPGPSADEAPSVVGWLTFYGDDFEGNQPAVELVLSLSFSEPSVGLVRRSLLFWMKPNTTNEDMKAFIRDELSAPS